jgi:hypothetical protein
MIDPELADDETPEIIETESYLRASEPSLAFVVGLDGKSRKKVCGGWFRGRASGGLGLAEIRTWMGPFMTLFEGADGHVRVEGRGFKGSVPEHGLDHPYVGAVLKHQRRHRVSEKMARARFADPRRPNVLPSEQGQVARDHRTPKSRNEKRRVVGVDQESRPNFVSYLSIHASARFPMGTIRSFERLPSRTSTVPRSASMS